MFTGLLEMWLWAPVSRERTPTGGAGERYRHPEESRASLIEMQRNMEREEGRKREGGGQGEPTALISSGFPFPTSLKSTVFLHSSHVFLVNSGFAVGHGYR